MAAAFVGLALVLCWPVLASGARWGFWDWDVFEALVEAGRRTLLEFHQLPGWNPWVRGGEPLLSHPLQPLASPAFGVIVALGTIPGIKLWICVRTFAALWGSWRLGVRLGFGTLGAVTVAVVFGMASTLALRVAHGHWNLQAVAWLPLLAASGLGALDPGAWRARVCAAGLLALLFLEGGPYVYTMGALVLAALCAVRLAQRRWSAAAALVAIVALSTGLSAVKLGPVFEAYGGGARDRKYGTEGRVTADFYQAKFQQPAGRILWQALLERDQLLERGERETPFYINVGAYIGWLGLAAVAAGAVFGGTVGRIALLLSLPFLWIVLASAAPLNLWGLLHELPIWRSMTIPSKFTACYLLGFAVAAGAGIDALERRFGERRGARAALAAFVALLAVDLGSVSRPVYRLAFPVDPIAVEPGPFHQVARSPFTDAYVRATEHAGPLPTRPLRPVHSLSSDLPGVRANLGTLDTYSGQPFPGFARPDAGDSLTLTQEGGEPRLVDWSPNALRIEVSPGGGRLVINHDFDPGWRADADGAAIPVHAVRGLLAVDPPPDARVVTLRWRSTSARGGAAVTLASLAVCGLLWRRERRGSTAAQAAPDAQQPRDDGA
jgi:hypothetical protein